MKKQSSGMVWLILSVVCFLIGFGGIVFGTFSLYHTHSNVKTYQDLVVRSAVEIEQLQKAKLYPGRAQALRDANDRMDFGLIELAGAKQYRIISVVILAASFLPGILSIAFGVVYFMKRKNLNSSEDDELEERPRKRKSKTPKPLA